jgi:uncharacterized protein YaaW (UPF0174 family)
MSEDTTEQLVFDVNANVTRAKTQLKSLMDQVEQLSGAMYGALGIMSRMGLPEEAASAMRIMQQAIITANMLRSTIRLLELEMGPVGWALFAIGVVGTTVSFADSIGNEAERRMSW